MPSSSSPSCTDTDFDQPTLWVHWGKTGGGPRFLFELVRGDMVGTVGSTRENSSARTNISYNPDAEIASRFAQLTIPAFEVPTYHTKIGVILNLPRLLFNSVRLRRWIKRNGVRKVVGVMESVYQSLAVPLLLPRNVKYISCIHDGTHHPGESSMVQRIGRKLELWRANEIAVFSTAVRDVLSPQTDKPIILGSHPPFGTGNGNQITAKSLPDNRPIKIGLFGRLQPYKGIDLLLEAAKLLRSRPNTPSFEIHIIGNGPAEDSRNGANGHQAIWDIRWIPEDEVDEIIDGLDILALPYIEASQSGPVSLALAHAVPCVVTPQGALPDQVQGFGIVSEETTSDSFAQALLKAMDRDTYDKLSASATHQVQTGLSWEDLAKKIRGTEVTDGDCNS